MNNAKSATKHHKKKKVKKVKKKIIEEAPPPDLTSENAKIEMIQALLLKTDLNEEELNEAYDVFYSKYPEGELNEDQFLLESKVRCWEIFPSLSLSPGRSYGSVSIPGLR